MISQAHKASKGPQPATGAARAKAASPARSPPAPVIARRPARTADALGELLAESVRGRVPGAAGTAVLARGKRKKQTTPKPKSTKAKLPSAVGLATGGVRKQRRVRVAAPPPRRSARERRAPNEVDRQLAWEGPAFGASTTFAGGISVSATLGPAAGQPTNYGSGPGVGACTAVNALNASRYAGETWIKGHLLNDNLGGQGVSENLTPMTHTANMRFKGFEAAVKNALTTCYSRGVFKRDAPGDWYGVRIDVRVSDELAFPAATEPAAQAVRAVVRASATYVRKVGDADPVDVEAPSWAPALPAAPVVVRCDERSPAL